MKVVSCNQWRLSVEEMSYYATSRCVAEMARIRVYMCSPIRKYTNVKCT
jgi:hypothetical protein